MRHDDSGKGYACVGQGIRENSTFSLIKAMSVWRRNDRWRHNWQELVADGMWRLMENEVSGMITKFPA